MLATYAWGNRRAYWCPVRMPLVPGTTQGADFVPRPDVLYEMEIEVNQPVTRAGWDEISPLLQLTNAPLVLNWGIFSNGKTLLAGNARDAAYLSARTASWRGRLKDALLFEAFHRDSKSRRTFGLSGGGTISRGVGYFRSSAATPHRIEVRMGTNSVPFAGGPPVFNVRRSRQEWLRHRRQRVPLAVMGYCSLAVSVAWWVFRRRSPPAFERRDGAGPLQGSA
jgi:hypothetical protein